MTCTKTSALLSNQAGQRRGKKITNQEGQEGFKNGENAKNGRAD